MLTVLWDNDGVLVDSEALFFQVTSGALKTLGVDLSEPLFQRISLREGRSTFDLARERGIGEAEIARVRAQRDVEYEALLRSRQLLLPGVEETVHALHGTVSMGIVTSARRMHFEAAHHQSGILDRFEFALTREDYQQSKPSPEPYLTAVERFGLDPGQCLVVEDSERGLASAVAAGLRCVVVPNALTAHASFPAAFRVLDSIRQLPETIRRLAP